MIEEKLQLRIHGSNELPTLVYLPGLHGDWTLVGRFRQQVLGKVRWVELTYPRTTTWSLDDYASAVEAKLAEHAIVEGWLLGESFGSQIVWPLVARGNFRLHGVILAGGFVRHPAIWLVRVAERFAGGVPLRLIVWTLFGYAWLARFRYRKDSRSRDSLDEFIARRTKPDILAAQHRLRLIASSNPCEAAKQTKVPLYAITGLWDPIVPWLSVRRWLRKHCGTLRQYTVLRSSDHNVLNNAAQTAATHILRWMGVPPLPDSSN